ncbi:CD225/dispanin family protein [Mesohalobacter halotolerans]|uniref:CD225/dispanin family protein n=1 Tax=Mesohalobacter halotolerans TaxID=1883405 RepID=A0A4U5TU20_9FLAO|nr:CD225/dispanin family protein [Mesohalobacter halotolerans]MBS3738495.1 CD225/dispanin family protein [Psychroflexus sp.]TKS57592.1 CD225/dispanin family protein [Mesohalobacter halotolerans]
MESKPKPPQNYLALSIISTLFCCQIFGIIAIIYASQVNSKFIAGDYQGAQSASNNAKVWSFLSIGIGLLVIIVFAIFYGAVAVAAISEAEF